MSEGNEPPTEHRLQEARKKGDTPQSADLSHALATLLWSLVLMAFAGTGLVLVCRYIEVLMIVSFGGKPGIALGWASVHLAIGVSSACAIGACAALLPDLLQSRGRWASKREWFDPARLNPIQRLKSVFAPPRLMQAPLACVRLVIVGAVAGMLCATLLPLLQRGSAGPWYGGYQMAWWAAVRLLCFSSVICAGLGLLDAWLQKQLWLRRNRMKRDEVQKEYKEQEGDPAIKGSRRQIHQESVS